MSKPRTHTFASVKANISTTVQAFSSNFWILMSLFHPFHYCSHLRLNSLKSVLQSLLFISWDISPLICLLLHSLLVPESVR